MIYITKKREALGMSQKKLGDTLGINPSVVSCWEAGTKSPRADKLPEIAKLLHCTIDDLFDKEEVNRSGQDQARPSA